MTSTQNRVRAGVPSGGEFAATAHSDNVPTLGVPAPQPGPTAPKTTSRGRTTYVTLPDGTVAERTSKTKNYTHAVVLGPKVPELVIANREVTIRREEANIAAREEALKDPKFTKRNRFPRDNRDPDMNYGGTEPSWTGFEYALLAADGRTQLETMWGNSKGDAQGSFDPDTLDYEHGNHGRVTAQLRLKAQLSIRNSREYIDEARADIEAVNAGTYDLGGYSVPSWSSRQDLAEKATNQYAGWDRRASVLPIDQ